MSAPHRIVDVDARDLPDGHATPGGCRKCSTQAGYLARYIKANGAASIRWVCSWCEDYFTRGDLPGTILRDYNVTALDLPIRRDRRDEYVPDECIVCTNQADEFHHWAPTAIFPDWPYSLGIYLCRDHHHEWHARMRAHGLRWPHELTPK